MSITYDIKTVLEELKEYPNVVNQYDIDKYMIRAVQESIYTSGYFPHDKDIILKENIKDSIIATKENILKKFGTFEIAITYKNFDGLSHYVRYNNDNELIYSARGQREIIFMIRYAINGIWDKDYSKSYEIYDAIKALNNIPYDAEKYQITFKIDNITVKLFKNGRVDLKGITMEQLNRIKEGFKTLVTFRGV